VAIVTRLWAPRRAGELQMRERPMRMSGCDDAEGRRRAGSPDLQSLIPSVPSRRRSSTPRREPSGSWAQAVQHHDVGGRALPVDARRRRSSAEVFVVVDRPDLEALTRGRSPIGVAWRRLPAVHEDLRPAGLPVTAMWITAGGARSSRSAGRWSPLDHRNRRLVALDPESISGIPPLETMLPVSGRHRQIHPGGEVIAGG